MKIYPILILLFVSAMFVGCMSSTTFQNYSGPNEFRGEGGAYVVKEGIEIYSSGAPARDFIVLGYVQNSMVSSSEFNAMFGDSHALSALAKEAKSHGANAILLLSSERDILGYSTTAQATGTVSGSYQNYGGGYGTYSGSGQAFGTSQTSTTERNVKVAAAIKFVDRSE